jgi:membrane-bound lytic murein transglycosylase F
MGYDYDLCSDFCKAYNLKLTVKVAANQEQMEAMIASGEGDLIAYPLPYRTQKDDCLRFCGLEQVSHQVLVQAISDSLPLLRDVTQLINREVVTNPNSKERARLENLDGELGGKQIGIATPPADSLSTEDLIEMVAEGKIPYTIADDNLARLSKTFYRNIDISLAVGGDQRSCWAVSRNKPLLARKLDLWFADKNNKPVYAAVMKKYFEMSKTDLSAVSDSAAIPSGWLSPYDSLFVKYGKVEKIDWKLLVAVAWQESRFKTASTSWAGATGLMGLMPKTAQAMGIGIEERTDPEMNIKAGSRLLRKLLDMFSKVPDETEKLKLTLASYNAGHGHILDARALCRKYGANPNVWEDNVKKYLILKSNPDYYTDSVCHNGFFRGTETVKYVDDVLKKWDAYKKRE